MQCMLGWGGSGCNSEALPEGRLARNSGVPRSCGTSDRVGEAEPARWASANRGRACHLRPPTEAGQEALRSRAWRGWKVLEPGQRPRHRLVSSRGVPVRGHQLLDHHHCHRPESIMVAMETAAASQGQHGSTSLPSGDPGAEDTTRSSLHLSLPTVPRPLPAPGCTGQPRVKGSRAVSLRTPCRGSPSSRPASSCSGSTGPAPPGSRGDG